MIYRWEGNTTSNTTIELFLDGVQYQSKNRMTLEKDTGYSFKVQAVAKQQASTNVGAWEFYGSIHRQSGNVTMNNLIKKIYTKKNDDWDINLLANTINNCLEVRVTGSENDTIGWTVTCDYILIK